MKEYLKNWKTTIAFFIFLFLFAYSVMNIPIPTKDLPNPSIALAEYTGFVVLIAWGLTKASSETLNNFISNIGTAFKEKMSK